MPPITPTRPEAPGSEGSPPALQILRALHRHPEGLSIAALSAITGLDLYAARDALTGLSDRGRVISDVRNKLIMWRTAQHHAEAKKACS